MKQKFYWRLHVWKIQCHLIDGGMSIIAANNRICSITGERSVTKIIDKLISFRNVYKEHGGIHPQLMNAMWNHHLHNNNSCVIIIIIIICVCLFVFDLHFYVVNYERIACT
jgi:hypothetical protein